MQIPHIPTDNLYKFMAIAGLVLFLICLLYPKFLVADAKKTTARTAAELATLKDESEILTKGVESIAESAAKLRATKGKLDRNEVERVDQEIQDSQLANKAMRANVRAFELNANVALAEAERSSFLVDVMLWAMFPSLALMLLGFVLWYAKAQRYADEILRLQVQAARAEVAAKKANETGESGEGAVDKWTSI